MTHPLATEALDDRMAIVGTSGSGKTYAARGMAEILVRAGHRLCVVDPLGVWWGMRAGRDGMAAGGLPVIIMGGPHADVPITEDMGARIGALVGKAQIQCVVDLMGLPSKVAMQRFMRAFLEALYNANTEPLHLVLDEADLWAPQRPMPDQTMLQGLVGEIVRRGRVRGFIPWLITQRPAVLDKDVLSQADALIAFKLTSSQDRAAIGSWIEGQADRAEEKRVLADLPRLPRGEAWIWVPGRGLLEQAAFPAITTFDSSRTPKRGEKRTGAALTSVNVAAIAAMLSAAAPPAPDRKTRSKAGPDELAAAREEGRRQGRWEAAREIGDLRSQNDLMRAAIKAAAGHLVGEWRAQHPGLDVPVLDIPPPPTTATIDPAPSTQVPKQAARAPKASTPNVTGAPLNTAAQAMLSVLARRHPEKLTWTQVATLSVLAPHGGHWNGGRKQLRLEALVVEKDGQVSATKEGVRRAGDLPPSPKGPAEVLKMWCQKLPRPASDILKLLAGGHEPMSRTTIASRLGIKPYGGHWNGGMKALRTNGLVYETAEGLLLVEELRDV